MNKLLAYLRRDLLVQLSYKGAFALDLLNTVLMVWLWYFLAGMFSSQQPLPTSSYFEYVFMGVIGLIIIRHLIERIGKSTVEAKLKGISKGIFVAPVKPVIRIFGPVLWLIVLTFVHIFLAVIVSRSVFQINSQYIFTPLSLLILLLLVGCLTSIGIAFSGMVFYFQKNIGSWASMFFAIFGGLFIPITVFPLPIQKAASLLPTYQGLNALRQVVFNNATLTEVAGALAYLIVFFIVCIPFSIFIFNFFINKARKDSTLGHF